jgi:hypothetical protein
MPPGNGRVPWVESRHINVLPRKLEKRQWVVEQFEIGRCPFRKLYPDILVMQWRRILKDSSGRDYSQKRVLPTDLVVSKARVRIDAKCHKLSLGLRLFSDALIRQLMLMPNGIENAAAARKTKAENPGEIPH